MISYFIDDSSGNCNGILEPDEEIELYYLLKNIGGVDIENLNGLLISSSPYLILTNNTSYFGNVLIDSLIRNSTEPFRLRALPDAPQGSVGFLDLILCINSGVIDTVRIKIIIGKKDFLVWDPDRNNSSGPVIHSILQNLGYNGDYISARFYSFEHLKNYKSLFVCAGVAYENFVLFRDCYEVAKIVDFINQGGNIYLEGGECWAFDPFVLYGFNFNPYFGIRPVNDGYTNMGPIEGVNNTFTEGMNFRYNGENFYLDVIDSTDTGFRIFYDQDDDYYCGIANITNNYRTVGVSFELAGLVDNEISTKSILLDSIMHFFGINLVDVEEKLHLKNMTQNLQLEIYPDPFTNHLVIKFQIPEKRVVSSQYPVASNNGVTSSQQSVVSLKIYDASGRMVRQWDYQTIRLSDQILWDGTDDLGRKLPSGIYFVRLETGELKKTEKVILLK